MERGESPVLEADGRTAILAKPLGESTPWIVYIAVQLGEAGYAIEGIGENPSTHDDDITLVEMLCPNDVGIVEIQTWRRLTGVIWLSEMIQVDGETVRLRYRDWIMSGIERGGVLASRLISAFGTSGYKTRRRLGTPTVMAWFRAKVGTVLRVNEDELGVIQVLFEAEAEVEILAEDGLRTRRGGQKWKTTGKRTRISTLKSVPIIMDAAESGDESSRVS